MKRAWHWIVSIITVGLCLMIVAGLLLSIYLLWCLQVQGDPAAELALLVPCGSLQCLRAIP